MNDITYIGYYFKHDKHRNYDSEELQAYITSIIYYINTLNKKIIFIIDSETHGKIKPFINNTNLKLIILNYEETDVYKKYFKRLNDNFNKNKNSDISNQLKTKIIWYFKFELLSIVKPYVTTSHICYLDCGIFSKSRRQFISDFEKNNFQITDYNDIIVNYTFNQIKQELNLENLFNNGAHEISCNHFLIKKELLENLNKIYFEKLEKYIDQNINITEQRIFTLVIKDIFLNQPQIISFKKINSSYDVSLHI
jgi:hypothetical protein